MSASGRPQPVGCKGLVGYLCVDSCEMNAFLNPTDVALMNGIADGLYNVVKTVRELEGSATRGLNYGYKT